MSNGNEDKLKGMKDKVVGKVKKWTGAGEHSQDFIMNIIQP